MTSCYNLYKGKLIDIDSTIYDVYNKNSAVNKDFTALMVITDTKSWNLGDRIYFNDEYYYIHTIEETYLTDACYAYYKVLNYDSYSTMKNHYLEKYELPYEMEDNEIGTIVYIYRFYQMNKVFAEQTFMNYGIVE